MHALEQYEVELCLAGLEHELGKAKNRRDASSPQLADKYVEHFNQSKSYLDKELSE